ncbi:DUF262 domain-containing protein [Helicobacter sp. NHP21005]|uniref:DUF262 domain-containing protein n=1 Tax=Helicobacter felistomachi TaxID=3040201 RepID=UPI002574861B|nr:DUF262 domain-containing HNH endonuclease family protein [Helicobacter sp. NHP21005]BEG57400.1 DUF262 domain-containing protein [Helicobacter sp. NHP21005]
MDTLQMDILDYLSKNRFVVPEYQRGYVWREHCEKLWEDITAFFEGEGGEATYQNPYFLGSVVYYPIGEKMHIVDGQQRTTTLMLLLKAMHTKLTATNNESVQFLVNKIASCLWDVGGKTGKIDSAKPHLISHAISDDKHQVLQNILENGLEQDEAEDNSNYEKNYRYFCTQLDEFAKDDPTRFEDLCLCVLESCIVLTVACNGQDDDKRLEYALRVFNTLNNRGLVLAETDIFKSVIFSGKSPKEREAFIAQWQDLEQKCDVEYLFRLCMHVLRARHGEKSREIGLHPFFYSKHRNLLKDGSIMQELEKMREFLYSDEVYSKISQRADQFYEVLFTLENGYWEFLNGAYYAYCLEKGKDYLKGLDEVLMRTCAHFLVYTIARHPGQIKNLIYHAYTSLYKTGTINFGAQSQEILKSVVYTKRSEHTFRTFFEATQTKRLTKALLLLNMYLKYPEQKVEVCEKPEIEHIFPKTWQTNYMKLDKKKASALVESIGNKILLEKPLNIKASNGYFDAKKPKYAKSKFLEAQDLAKLAKSDWLLEDIKARTEEIYQRLYAFFKEYAV